MDDATDLIDAPPAPEPAIPLPDAVFSFIGGPAGTGKSWLAREWAQYYSGVELCATTGIAAVNLGGRTINSILKYYSTEDLQDDHANGLLALRLHDLHHEGIRRLVLDEVSMLDGRQLTCLVEAIQTVNAELEYGAVEGAPERMGLTVVGDFCQLPPVKAPYAFEAPEWALFADHTILLDRVWRQEDPAFVAALRGVRRGEPTTATRFPWPYVHAVEDHFPGSTILAKNNAVDDYNERRLQELAGPDLIFHASRWGDQEREWAKQIPEALRLRPGALVMILANRAVYDGEEFCGYAYVNGDLAYVRDGNGITCQVELLRNPGSVVTVWPRVSEKTEAISVSEAEQLAEDESTSWAVKWDAHHEHPRKVVGQCTWMPLRLAYATTVHKSQGLSLDRVQIALADPFFGAPSMTYVALSRARTAAGLRLVGGPMLLGRRMRVDPKVRGWL
jgi:ATP-dependent DNA helicase PIF1